METLKKVVLFSLVIMFALTFNSCQKDKEITVTGTVTNSTGSGVEGVTVTTVGSVINTATTASDGTYTINVAQNGSLTFAKNGYSAQSKDVEGENTIDIILSFDPFAAAFSTGGNISEDPAFTGGVVPTSSNLGTPGTASDSWFTATTYKGAVNPSGTPWYDGWSFFSRIASGTTTSAPLTNAANVVTVTDASLSNAATINWTKDTTYILSGFVFVDSGQTLNIEAGTIIKGATGTGANASALVVARNGKIMAQGTASEPIIFTYENDNGGTEATQREQWGGLIILGNASLNSSPGTSAIEGIPTTETRGIYGGSTDNDNSGVLSYVSIRHGGSNIGADNEINGLTLGGVGSGTTIEYVEVIGNKDDGIEWFGGTVDAKYLISAYCGDDALDYDEGYRGRNQFVIVYQDPAIADRGGEHDGGTDPETATPYATPVFYNATFVGNSGSRIITFRDNAGGEYHNSIFTGFGKGIDIEDLLDQEQDSYKQWEDGNLKIENNVFYCPSVGTTGAELFSVSN
ncbi:MAG: carboxypeptidase-like regulatory domain-containing protein [Saprospiraceae bacterium]|nr:carboxypeptidase-like regulatory domain-containing protein [Saprospiraceae bacterium]